MSRKTNKSVTVHQMAQTLLKSCLFDVKKNLKVAAKDWRSNDEGVHQLRVSLRRTMACMDLFSEQFAVAKETLWLQKTLKELLKSAGKARDLDVLLAREMPDHGKAQGKLQKAWRSKRRECQKPLDRSFEALVREEKLQKKTGALLKRLSATPPTATNETSPDLRSWSTLQLSLRIGLLLKKSPEGSQLKGLHSFRVSAKQLRYVAELLQEIYPNKMVNPLLNLLASVQKKLGRLQDEAVAAKSVARLSSKVSRKQSKSLQSMSDESRVAAEARAVELRLWLNEKVVPELNRLAKVLPQPAKPAPKSTSTRKSVKRTRTAS
ncbi:MAG: CHAD domain-containing protein [Planctomycetaceae bacterium]